MAQRFKRANQCYLNILSRTRFEKWSCEVNCSSAQVKYFLFSQSKSQPETKTKRLQSAFLICQGGIACR